MKLAKGKCLLLSCVRTGHSFIHASLHTRTQSAYLSWACSLPTATTALTLPLTGQRVTLSPDVHINPLWQSSFLGTCHTPGPGHVPGTLRRGTWEQNSSSHMRKAGVLCGSEQRDAARGLGDHTHGCKPRLQPQTQPRSWTEGGETHLT